MTAPRFLPASLALVASGALMLLTSAAHALECAQSADCPKNFTCKVTMMSACPAIACAPGQTCPTCTPKEYHECVPDPCTANADCASGMVCVSSTQESCPGGTAADCAPGTKCPPPPAPTPCTTTTVTGCVPQYLVPCTTDASCGAGFTCVPDQMTSCSGGAGTAGAGSSGSAGASGTSGAPTPPPSSTGAPPPTDPLPPPDCTTMALATSHCEAKRQACKANSECPSGWLCEADPTSTVTSAGCAVPVYPDGGTGTANCPPPPPPPPPVLICVPPWFNLGYGGGVAQATDLGGALGIPKGGTSGNAGSGSPTVGSGSGAGPLVPIESAADAGAGSGAGSPHGTAASSGDSGGCQMGAGHARSSGAALLGALGLLGLARRRRFPPA